MVTSAEVGSEIINLGIEIAGGIKAQNLPFEQEEVQMKELCDKLAELISADEVNIKKAEETLKDEAKKQGFDLNTDKLKALETGFWNTVKNYFNKFKKPIEWIRRHKRASIAIAAGAIGIITILLLL